MVWPDAVSVLASVLVIALPAASVRLPVAAISVAELLLPRSLRLSSMSRKAAIAIAPELRLRRFAVAPDAEPSTMSRPAFMVSAAVSTDRPTLVANTSASISRSLLAPAAPRVMRPEPVLIDPSARRLPEVASRLRSPLVTLTVPRVVVPPAVNVAARPTGALRLSPALMVPPATKLACPPPTTRASVLPSLCRMAAPALSCRLPAAVMVVGEELLPLSLTFRFRSPVASSTMAPLPRLVRLTAEEVAVPTRMSPAESSVIAATVVARLPWVVCRLPVSSMSPEPVVVRLIVPLPAVPAVSGPGAIAPLVSIRMSCPALHAPALNVWAWIRISVPALAVMPDAVMLPPASSVSWPEVAANAKELPSVLRIAPPACRTRSPAAVRLLALDALPLSLTFRFRSRAASRRMAPVPLELMLVVEPVAVPSRMSRPEVTAMARSPGASAALLACRLPSRTTSPAAAVLVTVMLPLLAVMALVLMPVTAFSAMAWPAVRVPVATRLPVVAVRARFPAVAVAVPTVLLPVVAKLMLRLLGAVMLLPASMLPAAPIVALPLPVTRAIGLTSVLRMDPPALKSRSPGAVMVLAAELLPLSLTFRLILLAAFRRRAPVPSTDRFEDDPVAEPIRMSLAEVTLTAATLAARPVVVVCNAPTIWMSPVPVFVRVTRPCPAVPAVIAPSVRMPALVVRVICRPAVRLALVRLALLTAISRRAVTVMPVDVKLPPDCIRTSAPLDRRPSEFPSVLETLEPAWRSRFPAAAILVLAELLPLSLTFRFRLLAACSRIAPEVLLVMLVALALAVPSRMSRPEVTEMAATLDASPVLVAWMWPSRTTSPVPPVLMMLMMPLLAVTPLVLMPLTAVSVIP